MKWLCGQIVGFVQTVPMDKPFDPFAKLKPD